MKLKNYVYPKLIIKSLRDALRDITYFKRYKTIVEELYSDDKLSALGIVKQDYNMMIGIDLNPELLLYADLEALEAAELRMVGEKLKKYTNFLQKEKILDSIKVDYERIKTKDYYGYIVMITYDFKKYKKNKFRYDIGYLIFATLVIVSGLYVGFRLLF